MRPDSTRPKERPRRPSCRPSRLRDGGPRPPIRVRHLGERRYLLGRVVRQMTTDFATRTPAEADWPQNRSSFHERTFGRPPLVEHVETSVVAVEPSALATPAEAGISPPRTSRRRSRLVGMTVTSRTPSRQSVTTKRGSTSSANGIVQGTTRSLYSGCRFKNVTTNGQVARTFHVRRPAPGRAHPSPTWCRALVRCRQATPVWSKSATPLLRS